LLNLALVPMFGHAGLALSIALGALINAGLLYVGLVRKRIYRPRPGWLRFALQLTVALGAMLALLWWAVPQVDWTALRAQPWLRMALTLGLVAGAGALYLGVLLALGLRPRHFLRRTA
jgi:putative peptidoglycan lipid II flippase